jgi:aryl-alcohol dehydrogenase-like predicted oxidoreductase
MDHRFLGKTGVRISKLAFGTMSFGGDADEATSAALFARCRDAGVNFFDCADVYAKGRSEEILGKLVAGCRDEVVISSKAYFPTSDDVNARGSSRYHLVRAVEASLRRLGTDRIDVFFLHRFDDVTTLEDTLTTLENLVRQGKILYPAVSNFSAWQTAKALGLSERRGFAPLVATQPMYNLLKRQAEVEILPHALAEQIAVLPYSPLGAGLLSGKYGVGRAPDRGRAVDNAMYKTRYGAPSNFEIAEAFTQLAAELGLHPATLAIAWVASTPGVTAPLVGARNLEQLEPCLAAAELALDAETRARVSALSPEPPPATDRNEEKSAHNYGSR